MTIRAALLSAALLPLAACNPVLQDTADQLARDQARTFVNAEVARRLPGVDATPVTDCVIDNASTQDIVTIAGGVALGDGDTASDTVGAILRRPETTRCAAEAYAGGVLDGFL